MITEIIHAEAGDHIDEFTNKLVSVWNKRTDNGFNVALKGFIVEGEFNGVTLTATGKETPEMLRKHYSSEMEKQVEEYRNSLEYKEQEERRKKEVIELQKRYDRLIAGISSHDFKNINATLDMVLEYYEVTDNIGVQFNHEKFCKTLEDNGYVENANTEQGFDENNDENYARYIIGQFIACIRKFGACPPIISSFYEKHKNKFRPTIATA